jgi:hypothetical protein
MTGSNIFRIFKQGVGLINGGLTAVVKFSNAIGDKPKRKTLKHHKIHRITIIRCHVQNKNKIAIKTSFRRNKQRPLY